MQSHFFLSQEIQADWNELALTQHLLQHPHGLNLLVDRLIGIQAPVTNYIGQWISHLHEHQTQIESNGGEFDIKADWDQWHKTMDVSKTIQVWSCASLYLLLLLHVCICTVIQFQTGCSCCLARC